MDKTLLHGSSDSSSTTTNDSVVKDTSTTPIVKKMPPPPAAAPPGSNNNARLSVNVREQRRFSVAMVPQPGQSFSDVSIRTGLSEKRGSIFGPSGSQVLAPLGPGRQIVHSTSGIESRHPYLLHFYNEDLEIQYKIYMQEHLLPSRTFLFAISGVLVALFLLRAIVPLALTFPESSRLVGSIILALLGSGVPLLASSFLSYYSRSLFVRNHIQGLLCILLLISGSCAVIFVDLLFSFSLPFQASMFTIIYSFALYAFRIRFVFCLLCTLPLTLGFCIYVGLAPAMVEAEIMSIIYVCVSSLVMILLCYEQERTSRNQFLHSNFLTRHNTKLREQLHSLKMNYTSSGADFDSPLEKVNALLNSLLADPAMGVVQLNVIMQALNLINTTNVLQPDLEGQIKGGQVSIDRDTEDWLFTELAQRERTFTMMNSAVPPSPRTNAQANHPIAMEELLASLDVSPDSFHTVNSLLEKAERDFNFDLFELKKACNNHTLVVLGYHFFVVHGLLETFSIPPQKFKTFLMQIEAGYRDNPYHNSTHAADVLHATVWFLVHSELKTAVNDMDKLICFLAAIIHDFDHPGLSNVFQVNASTTKAIVYNDRSVLENHHLAASFLLLESHNCNFLSHLPKEKHKQIRHGVIELVLATDLAQHFKVLSQFKAKYQAEGFDFEKIEDKLLVLQMVIKAADVNNGAKAPHIYKAWTNLVMEEFYLQGDEERRLGLTISPFMDRQNPKLAQCQKGFLEFICLPLYEAFNAFVNIPDVLLQLQGNAAYWQTQLE